MGWYQTEDITNYELSDTYKHNKQIDMKEIVDDIPRFIASCRDSLKNKRISELPDLGRIKSLVEFLCIFWSSDFKFVFRIWFRL